MKPTRIQLSRRKGFRKPPNTVVVSRPSKWGNPFKPTDYKFANTDGSPAPFCEADARAMAIRDFRAALEVGLLRVTVEDVRRELKGKNLACWCKLPKPGEIDHCHAAVLLEVAAGRALEVANS